MAAEILYAWTWPFGTWLGVHACVCVCVGESQRRRPRPHRFHAVNRQLKDRVARGEASDIGGPRGALDDATRPRIAHTQSRRYLSQVLAAAADERTTQHVVVQPARRVGRRPLDVSDTSTRVLRDPHISPQSHPPGLRPSTTTARASAAAAAATTTTTTSRAVLPETAAAVDDEIYPPWHFHDWTRSGGVADARGRIVSSFRRVIQSVAAKPDPARHVAAPAPVRSHGNISKTAAQWLPSVGLPTDGRKLPSTNYLWSGDGLRFNAVADRQSEAKSSRTYAKWENNEKTFLRHRKRLWHIH